MTSTTSFDPFGARDTFTTSGRPVGIYRTSRLEDAGLGAVSRLPYSLRTLLESALRKCDGDVVTEDDVKNMASWKAAAPAKAEFPFMPARVVLQDFTGVPCVVDLAAMRSAMKRLGGDPKAINPLIPVDLVIDHSVQVDQFGTANALELNVDREFQRNGERYQFLKWGQKALANFRAVPPSVGIVHQVNLEFLAKCVFLRSDAKGPVALPDTLVGTDSHTTMINGLGVVGWGVGGIEAEAVMLGQPLYMLLPDVVGFELTGELPAGATATDLVLTVTQILRKERVVGKFVEFFGDGVSTMRLADRATIANMAPEYGATMGFFPIDDETLNYLRRTGRTAEEVELVERYAKEQGLFRRDGGTAPTYTKKLSLDLGSVAPCLAGPKRPQDRVPLADMKSQWQRDLSETFGKPPTSVVGRWEGEGGTPAGKVEVAKDTATAVADEPEEDGVEVRSDGASFKMRHGHVVIAAITSCTNTSNPSVMVGAGLLAKRAVERGLKSKPWVKTSLAPGSGVVTDYLQKSGLARYLDELHFNLVGYGCTTCIGNSGPLPEPIARAVEEHDLVVAAVLSGNRNFEGRINPHVRANYLASPPLVVAYALAGTTDIDLVNEPLGTGKDGRPVMLRDVWPSKEEIDEIVERCIKPEMFASRYGRALESNERWNKLPVKQSELYAWDESSTYIQEPPFLADAQAEPEPIRPIEGARVLAMLGDSVTTDHISPAGSIAQNSPAGRYLIEHGVEPRDFNSYGSRRGNDRVMVRGTFANIRIRNQLAPGTEGGVTRHLPDGEVMTIYDAAMKYREEDVPLVVLAGSEYGTGSSRDWAAKGTYMLGVRAVIAASYERIHRSNLVGMGVLPLEFPQGQSRDSRGLTGEETFDVLGLDDSLKPRGEVLVRATDAKGKVKEFRAKVRIDAPVELEYYRHGGILPAVLRKLLVESRK